MDETAYRNAQGEINRLPCVFERALLARHAVCELAASHQIAEREFYKSNGKDVHDATWSPDGTQILFALGKAENNQFYIMDFNGSDPQLVNDTIDSSGRSDWSNNLISFDQGEPYLHDVFLMNTDGSDLRQVTQGNNSQGASLSPDGMWVTFTAYTADSKSNPESCEIFIMRVDGTDIRNLTDNSYCDYQPRWGK